MARTYKVNGTLALKPCYRRDNLELIECHGAQIERREQRRVNTVFDHNLTVGEVFDTSKGIRMFASATERVQAAFAGGACISLFFFLTLISCF